MPNLQIRDLPAGVYQALSADARRENRSLTQQAIVELREAQAMRRRRRQPEVLEMLKNSERRFGFLPGLEPETLLQVDRDR